MPFPLQPSDPRVHVFALRPGPLRLGRRTHLEGEAAGDGEATLRQAFGVISGPSSANIR